MNYFKLLYLYPETEKKAGGWASSFSGSDDGMPQAVKFNIREEGKQFSRTVFIPT